MCSCKTNQTIRLLGCDMHNWSMDEAIADLDDQLQRGQQTTVTYLNADCLNKACVDEAYLRIIHSSDRVFPDGSGIKIGCQMTGQQRRANINGTDMFPRLCALAEQKQYRLYFLGGQPGVVDAMVAKLHLRYPRLLVAGMHHGFLDSPNSEADLLARINASNADILFVAMGAPRQEAWIAQHAKQLSCTLLLGVGGLFDFNAERIPRAPLWVRRIGCEWVWRLWQEPARMWRRYILGNPLFIYRVWRYGKQWPGE